MFNAEKYVEANYKQVSPQDLFIMARLINRHRLIQGGTAIDIGGAVNLYPLLVMLPFYESITITDIVVPNLLYLEKQKKRLSKTWEQYVRFINLLGYPYYPKDFSRELLSKVHSCKASIYDLEPNSQTSISMNFVAESITNDYTEFGRACTVLMNALKPEGYITATFMGGSRGYNVGGIDYPAVSISRNDVLYAFNELQEKRVYDIPPEYKPIRKGYNNIIILEGQK